MMSPSHSSGIGVIGSPPAAASNESQPGIVPPIISRRTPGASTGPSWAARSASRELTTTRRAPLSVTTYPASSAVRCQLTAVNCKPERCALQARASSSGRFSMIAARPSPGRSPPCLASQATWLERASSSA